MRKCQHSWICVEKVCICILSFCLCGTGYAEDWSSLRSIEPSTQRIAQSEETILTKHLFVRGRRGHRGPRGVRGVDAQSTRVLGLSVLSMDSSRDGDVYIIAPNGAITRTMLTSLGQADGSNAYLIEQAEFGCYSIAIKSSTWTQNDTLAITDSIDKESLGKQLKSYAQMNNDDGVQWFFFNYFVE